MPFWEIRGRAERRVLPAFLLLYQEGRTAAVTADPWKARDVSFHHADNPHVSFLLVDNQRTWRAETCPSLIMSHQHRNELGPSQLKHMAKRSPSISEDGREVFVK